MNTLVAIDPGASGGIAWSMNGSVVTAPMPETHGDILELLREIAVQAHSEFKSDPVAYLEEVGGFIGRQQPGSAMFKFGRNYGFLLGTLMTLGFRVELVRPQKWQRGLGIGTKSGLETREWKAKLREKAQQLYPTQKVTLKTADALLILEYGRKTNGLD